MDFFAGEALQQWIKTQNVRVLTEQDDDAKQNGHQGAGAEPRPRRERLCVARLHVALAVAGADSDGQRVGAALHRELAVGYDHGHVVDAHVQAAVAVPPCEDRCCVVWWEENQLFTVEHQPINHTYSTLATGAHS